MGVVGQIEKYAARSIARLPAPFVQRLGSSIHIDGQTLDPHLKIVLAVNKSKGGFETLGSVIEARKAYRHIVSIMERPKPPVASIRDRSIDSEHGAIPIRVYECLARAPRPAVVFFHGGGHVIGDLETHDGLCRRFCCELEATIVAVDYRLAPEHPFPAGVDDCVAAARWVVGQASELGIDPKRIALAGDSAGGNLAAVVSQEVEGIAFQLLIYPSTDSRTKTPSKALFAEGFGLDTSTVDWFFGSYTNGASRELSRISPAAGEGLGKSPPTHIATAGFDVLRDEGRAYGGLLEERGVRCTVENHSSLSHGFVHFTRLPSCDAAVVRLIDVLRQELC